MGRPERVTPLSFQRGTHSYKISPDGKWALRTWSGFGVPTKTEVVRLPGHETVWRMKSGRALEKKLGKLRRGKAEFFKTDIGAGVPLDAWCMKPPDFDPSRLYPVLFYVYGEPRPKTVLDSRGVGQAMFHRMIARLGFLVDSMDNQRPCGPARRPGQEVDYMTYPNRNHGLREGRGTVVHVRMSITKYFLERLPAGPR